MKRKDLSDYNSLKNQQNQASVLKRYKKVLKPKPSNLQNYYSYLTNKKPLLDELNYLSNTQIANAKNEVAKQLENATILNDKFKLKLEEDKKRAEEETKQRKARQEEIFKKELFDANTRQEDEKKAREAREDEQNKLNLAQKLQGAIRAREAKGIRDLIERGKDKEFIAKENGQIIKRRIEPRMKEIFAANEKYSKDYLKKQFREKQLEELERPIREAKKEAASKIQGAIKREIAKKELKSRKLLNTNVSEMINKFENAPRNQSNQLTLYKGSNQPKPLKLPKK
jgi:hypothetical protein